MPPPMSRAGFRPVLLAAALFGLFFAPPAAANSNVSSFTLENGMRGVVIEDHRAPVVTHMVWYRVGAADEPQGVSGIAHFLEHLMFKGTDDIPEGAFSKVIAENGGQDNAFTSYDYTAYFQQIAADRLDLVMKMEADRMKNLRLTEALVDPERAVILEERSQRTDNDPGALFREQMQATMFLNHPYRKPVIGWRSEMERLSLDDALSFYEAHYAPDNAILVVAGDVAPDEVEALAKEHYGPIEAAGVEPRSRPVEPPHRAARELQMSDPRVRQPYTIREYLVPSRRTGGDETAAALTMLAEVAGGGVTSRLSKALQLEDRIAINTGAYYSGSSYDEGSFGLYGVPAEGVPLGEIEAAIDETMATLAKEGPTKAELERARTVIRAGEIYAQDSQQGLARRYGAGLTTGLTIERIESWTDTLAAVTAEDVMAAAKLLRPEAAVTGRLTGAENDSTPSPASSEAVQ